jgi:primosomal protein N' (replication factor Y)
MVEIYCAKVSLSNLNFSIDKEFSYQIPNNLKNEVEIGTRVIVPFGRTNKKREGVVTDIFGYDGVMPLKPIYQTIDSEKLISKESIDLARFISKKYYSSLYDAILLLMPPGSNIKFLEYVTLISNKIDDNMSDLKRFIIDYLSDKNEPVSLKELETKTGNDSVRKAVIELKKAGIVEITEENQNAHNQKSLQVASLLLEEFETRDYMEQFLKKAFAQRRVLEMLMEDGKMPIVDLIAFSGASRGSITSLQKKGIIDITDEILEVDPFILEKTKSGEKPILNIEQENVVNRILEKRKDQKYSEFLIKGVTGSGKTEVYLELVEHIIREEKQAIILVPEIALTPQIRLRFFNRFGENVAVLHSALSISERKAQWRKIEDGEVRVVVGARSAVFAPFSNLSLIIVDEEHETTYKSENTPRYNAKDIARYRLEKTNGTLVLSSATPSVENYYRAKIGEIELLTLENRYNNVGLPEVEIVDMRDELKNGNNSVLSESLRAKLMEVKKNEQKAIILLNRRGYSTFVSCRDCGFVIKCPKCDVALTYHSISGELQCHYCGYSEPLVNVCPDCHSTSLRYFGSGTQKLEEELYKMFSDTQIVRMDNDTTTTKMSHERLLTQFSKEKCAILLGTQMIAKGLDFKDVAVVGVISADSSLFLGGFNGAEKTFSLITQVCGRAGRGEKRGNAIVQTYNPEHYAILASQDQDYDKFYENEIAFRKNMKYPPFCEIINVIFTGDDADKIFAMADGIKKIMTEKVDLYGERESYIAMYGPVPCGIAKIRDKYRFHILIKCISAKSIQNSFSEAVKELILKNTFDINVAVDVNPVNFI